MEPRADAGACGMSCALPGGVASLAALVRDWEVAQRAALAGLRQPAGPVGTFMRSQLEAVAQQRAQAVFGAVQQARNQLPIL